MNKQISAIAIYSEISSAIVLLDNVTAMTDSEADDLGQAELALGRARHMFASGALALFEEAPAMVAALRDCDEACQAGLNSAEPKHWEAALSDILDIIRPILSRIDGAGEALPDAPAPAPTVGAPAPARKECASKHFDRGDDVCADCGADLS